MRQNLDKLHSHHQTLGAAASVDRSAPDNSRRSSLVPHGAAPLELRPILYADRRLAFLNGYGPFTADTSALSGASATTRPPYHSWPLLDDARRTVFKLQALLCSGQLGRDVLQEIVYFAEANAPIAGLDSIVALLLPDAECADHLLETRPDRLLAWAIDRIDGASSSGVNSNDHQQHQQVGSVLDTDRRWSALLIRILERKAQLVKRHGAEYFEQLLRGERIRLTCM